VAAVKAGLTLSALSPAKAVSPALAGEEGYHRMVEAVAAQDFLPAEATVRIAPARGVVRFHCLRVA
jgi:hypothetical protein